MLLDVNALVALAWDSHVHHHVIAEWFDREAASGWATCPTSESGFVRISSHRRILPVPASVPEAQAMLGGLRALGEHRFLVDDVSMVDDDVPSMMGHSQVTDAQLLTVARRHGAYLVTFDRGVAAMAAGREVTLLSR